MLVIIQNTVKPVLPYPVLVFNFSGGGRVGFSINVIKHTNSPVRYDFVSKNISEDSDDTLN